MPLPNPATLKTTCKLPREASSVAVATAVELALRFFVNMTRYENYDEGRGGGRGEQEGNGALPIK
jgi:hypothetical protein